MKHCWQEYANGEYEGSCLLPPNHEGNHEFTFDNKLIDGAAMEEGKHFKDRQSAINVLWATLLMAVPGADDPRPANVKDGIAKQVLGSAILALEDLGVDVDEMKEAQDSYEKGLAFMRDTT